MCLRLWLLLRLLCLLWWQVVLLLVLLLERSRLRHVLKVLRVLLLMLLRHLLLLQRLLLLKLLLLETAQLPAQLLVFPAKVVVLGLHLYADVKWQFSTLKDTFSKGKDNQRFTSATLNQKRQ